MAEKNTSFSYGILRAESRAINDIETEILYLISLNFKQGHNKLVARLPPRQMFIIQSLYRFHSVVA